LQSIDIIPLRKATVLLYAIAREGIIALKEAIPLAVLIFAVMLVCDWLEEATNTSLIAYKTNEFS
jgi:hypothetical protein